jgi:hypothetical protein
MSTCFKTKFEEAEEGEGRWEYWRTWGDEGIHGGSFGPRMKIELLSPDLFLVLSKCPDIWNLNLAEAVVFASIGISVFFTKKHNPEKTKK